MIIITDIVNNTVIKFNFKNTLVKKFVLTFQYSGIL